MPKFLTGWGVPHRLWFSEADSELVEGHGHSMATKLRKINHKGANDPKIFKINKQKRAVTAVMAVTAVTAVTAVNGHYGRYGRYGR